MILLHFRLPQETEFRLGAKTPAGVLDVWAANSNFGGSTPTSLKALMAAGEAGLLALQALIDQALSGNFPLVDELSLIYGPCVLDPQKILCIGLNYRKHAIELGMAIPQSPVLFSKFNNALAACGEAVPLASNAIQYDYEAELVVVIGKRARYVSKEAALEYVFGYCNGDDLSARDLQMRTPQWLLGKTPDKFMPTGPYLVTVAEAGDPNNKTIRCWLNGEQRQSSNTGDMVFSVVELIHYVSQYMTLEPGDLISTGTPAGVILGMKEKTG